MITRCPENQDYVCGEKPLGHVWLGGSGPICHAEVPVYLRLDPKSKSQFHTSELYHLGQVLKFYVLICKTGLVTAPPTHGGQKKQVRWWTNSTSLSA